MRRRALRGESLSLSLPTRLDVVPSAAQIAAAAADHAWLKRPWKSKCSQKGVVLQRDQKNLEEVLFCMKNSMSKMRETKDDDFPSTHKHSYYHQQIHVARHVAVAKFCFMEKGALNGDGYGASAGPSVSSAPAATPAAAAGPAPAPQHPPPF